MEILLADRQDITRAGLMYVIESFNGITTRYIEDKAELLVALQHDANCVVVLDYTLFDINDSAELMILSERYTKVRWVLFCEDLSVDFVHVLVSSSLVLASYLKNVIFKRLEWASIMPFMIADLYANEWLKCYSRQHNLNWNT